MSTMNPVDFRITTKLVSIGELMDRLAEGRLTYNIDPFLHDNWMTEFIESILLSIPSLPIYARDEKDIWKIVDGNKRIMTLSMIIRLNRQLLYMTVFSDYSRYFFDTLPKDLQRRIVETKITVHLIEQGVPDEVAADIKRRWKK